MKTCTHKDLCMNVHSSIIHNIHQLVMDKQNVVYIQWDAIQQQKETNIYMFYRLGRKKKPSKTCNLKEDKHKRICSV